MIDEEATKEAFGYYPSALKLQSSRKPIQAACDECGKIRTTTKQAYRALCGSCSQKGRVHTKERNHKISEALKGTHRTEETKALISIAQKGNTHARGYKRSDITKALQSVAMKGKTGLKGNKNPNWKGGISFEPYCVKFNNAFKEYIRSKFGYKCFLCPTTQAENGKKLCVHHVNYNKDCGCDGDKTCNFVPLCISCHSKTNFNRDYWEKLITNKLHLTIIGWAV